MKRLEANFGSVHASEKRGGKETALLRGSVNGQWGSGGGVTLALLFQEEQEREQEEWQQEEQQEQQQKQQQEQQEQ